MAPEPRTQAEDFSSRASREVRSARVREAGCSSARSRRFFLFGSFVCELFVSSLIITGKPWISSMWAKVTYKHIFNLSVRAILYVTI